MTEKTLAIRFMRGNQVLHDAIVGGPAEAVIDVAIQVLQAVGSLEPGDRIEITDASYLVEDASNEP